MNVRLLIACCFVAATFGSCVTTYTQPEYGAAGSLAGVNEIVYVGSDYSGAVFYDPYIEYNDLVNSKIPSWNRRALEDVLLEAPVRINSDLDVSTERNKTIESSAVLMGPTTPAPKTLNLDVLRQEISPYVSASKSGTALLFVVESVIKDYGFISHFVVFNRANGEVILWDQGMTQPGGFGVHNYYLNALKEQVENAMSAINWAKQPPAM